MTLRCVLLVFHSEQVKSDYIKRGMITNPQKTSIVFNQKTKTKTKKRNLNNDTKISLSGRLNSKTFQMLL